MPTSKYEKNGRLPRIVKFPTKNIPVIDGAAVGTLDVGAGIGATEGFAVTNATQKINCQNLVGHKLSNFMFTFRVNFESLGL